MQTWRLIRSGACAPALNMAVDEALLLSHAEGKTPPTVRFYGWNPPTLSIGFFQKAAEEVEMAKLEAAGVGFVRRPTGGRAVLHDRELTYSIVVSESHPGIPASVTEAYRVLSRGLLQGFLRLGLEARMEDAPSAAAPGSAACFDSPSWYELTVEGRKVAGSAQMRHKGVLLQHGSILLDLDADLLFSLLAFRTDERRERMKRAFAKKAAAINPLLQETSGRPPIGIKEAEEAFREGFAEGLGIRLVEGELTEEERACAERLAREKYGSDEWNLRR